MIIYDLEIQKLIPPRDGERLSDFQYCDGWHDHFGMGVACVVLFDTARSEYRVYDEYMLGELKASFERTDVVVGFNIVNFDNKVLAPYDVIVPEKNATTCSRKSPAPLERRTITKACR